VVADAGRGEGRRRWCDVASVSDGWWALVDYLDQPAGHEDEDEPWAEGGCGYAAGEQVQRPAQWAAVLAGASPAGGDEAGSGPHGDGGDGRACAGPGGLDPDRWGPGQEQHGQGEDEDQAGDDERGPAHQRAEPPADPPGAEDRELGGGWPG
jgi:hypothetical protein